MATTDLQGQMRLMAALCDPRWTYAQVEALRKEMVTYASVPDIRLPRSTEARKYYQAELPWGDEPVPNTGSTQPYRLTPAPPEATRN